MCAAVEFGSASVREGDERSSSHLAVSVNNSARADRRNLERGLSFYASSVCTNGVDA
jgi:hypothetical protein